MPEQTDYLIIGAGMAASAAALAIREFDRQAGIVFLGSEPDRPYARPPLSKGLWRGDPVDGIWRLPPDFDAHVQLDRTAVSLDRVGHLVRDDAGTEWHYKKLLIASGGSPRRLPFGQDFIYYRTLDDYRSLRLMAAAGSHVAVIGGGFVGSELAAALCARGCRVTMLFPEAALGACIFPADLADFVSEYYAEKGVALCPGIRVTGATSGGNLELSDGSVLEADTVVAGLGITPNVELAEDAGLIVNNGIRVDSCMRTSDPDIYAAGDVASFPAVSLGRHMRVEHEDAAVSTGRCAGQCMVGLDAPYTELPFFHSDLFDLSYEAVGVLDSQMETVQQWTQPKREGVIYYLDGGLVRGVLLWNTWGQVPAARKLIADAGPFDADTVLGKLPIAE